MNELDFEAAKRESPSNGFDIPYHWGDFCCHLNRQAEALVARAVEAERERVVAFCGENAREVPEEADPYVYAPKAVRQIVQTALAAKDAQVAEAVEALEYLTGNRGHTGPSCVRTPNGGPAITPDEFCAVCRGYSTLARLRSR